ncbi:hypothetical protein BRPE64_BCDS10570 [Caballeronia insecticola]|uniref:Uncharacterized protein n=1 Tax=Caballeronia insecticola TaxID=758793 RepID=R4WM79_9BURK|nr:hypothetical protein BRPE64_BCDS10570 [Caballeronia insecticola]
MVQTAQGSLTVTVVDTLWPVTVFSVWYTVLPCCTVTLT